MRDLDAQLVEELKARHELRGYRHAWYGLRQFRALLRTEAEHRQVVSRADNARIWHRHFLDSAQLGKHIRASDRRIIDIGSGNGFPGIVLALLYPQCHVTLIERRGGFCRFLHKAQEALQCSNLSILQASLAESGLPTSGELRGVTRGDVLIARAVGSAVGCYRMLRHLGGDGSRYLLPKGASWPSALKDLRERTNLQWRDVESVTNEGSRILIGDARA